MSMSDMEESRRRRSLQGVFSTTIPKPTGTRDLIMALMLAAAALFVIVLYLLGTSSGREHTVAAMQAELATLPAYPGSTLSDTSVFNVWDRAPAVDASYTVGTDVCPAVQDFYRRSAPVYGWSLKDPTTSDPAPSAEHPRHAYLATSFRKVVNGEDLTLLVTCQIDGTTGYGLSISPT